MILTQTSPAYGIEAACYDVELEGERDVESFINEVLENDREWGMLTFKLARTMYDLEYRYGEADKSKLPKRVLHARVCEVKAQGGWSMMNYHVIIEK